MSPVGSADTSVTSVSMTRGVLLNVASQVVLAATGFFLTAFLVHRLGASDFGAWVLIGSVLAYSSLLDFGVGLTVMRFVAEVAHLPDRDQANRLISSAVVVYTSVGLVVLVGGLVFAPQIADLFTIAPSAHDRFILAFRISVVGLAVTFPSAVWTAALQGLRDFARLNLILVAQTLSVMFAEITVVALGYNIVALAIVNAVGSIVLFLGKRAMARRHGIRTSPRLCSTATFRRIIRVSFWVFLLNIASRLILSTDAVLVGIMLGTASVAAYQVALSPATAVRTAADQFNSVSLTSAASLNAQARDARERLQLLLVEATRAVVCVFLPCIAMLAAWGQQFLTLWVGPEFRSSYATLVVLTTGILAIAIQGTSAQVLFALDRHRLMSLIAGAEAICNLGLSILLGRRFGIVGVALGTTIPTLITSFGITVPYACRLVGLPYRSLLRRLLPPVGIAAIGLVAMVAYQDSIGTFSSLAALAVASIIVVGGMLCASLLADDQSRQIYLPMLRALAPHRVRELPE